jgi:hypothetical protein
VLFPAATPGLRISSVGGLPVPAIPSGAGDVTLPALLANPVVIDVVTSGLPVGSIVKVSVLPQNNITTRADSPPTTGTIDNATSSVSLNIPPGASVISAQVTFNITQAMSDALMRFAQGEKVERITLTNTLGGKQSVAVGHTASGREIEIPLAALTLAGGD